MNNKVEKTHRCTQLLEHNQQNKHTTIRIYYGKLFRWKENEPKKWCLEQLRWDSEWDTRYMSYVCNVNYCPMCGVRLDEDI